MRKIGYARVSTDGQDTALQIAALRAAGCAVIYEDRASGADYGRPGLHSAIVQLLPGDTLVFWKLDRVARGLSDLLRILERIDARGALVKSLTEPIDTTTPIGVFTLQMLGAFAQLERSVIVERTRAGQAAARARGESWGRPRLVADSATVAAMQAMRSGGVPVPDIAAVYCCSESTVRRRLRGA